MKFGKATVQPGAERASRKGPAPDANAYALAREEWNDRYGSYIASARNWRVIAFMTSLMAIVAVCGVVYIGSKTRFIPYIVEVDKLGQASTIGYADKAAPTDQRMIKAFMARFLQDFRTVSPDAVAQKAAIDRLYSMVSNGTPGLSKLNAYFQESSPFKAAQSGSVAVNISTILAISPETWQIEWLETKRNLTGEILDRSRYKASFTIRMNPPQDEKLILVNPLGIFVTDMNWSKQL